jgi:assimilatory nitrate reductase catalytic subunit
MVSLPNSAYVRDAYEKLEFFCQVDFFLSEAARYADVVLAGSLMERTKEQRPTSKGASSIIRRLSTRPATPGRTGRSSAISPLAWG